MVFLSVEAERELRMEEKKTRILLDSNFIIGIYHYSVVWNVFQNQ